MGKSYTNFALRRGSSNTTSTISRQTENVHGPVDQLTRSKQSLQNQDQHILPNRQDNGKRQKQGTYIPSGKQKTSSVTVSELNSAPGYRPRSPTRSNPQGFAPKLKTRPSSPLLGERYQAASAFARSAADSKSRTLKEYGSSSTLHSHYDAQKSPLSISQQTSASAARDYTLKKGSIPVMPAPDQFSRPSSRRDVAQSDTLMGTTKQEPRSRSNSKHRPRPLDLSTFFPKPATSKAPLLSPHRYTNSPSPFSESSRISAQTGPAPQIKKLTKAPVAKSQRVSLNPPLVGDRPLPKLNVRRPRKSVQYWFDGPEGQVSDDEESIREPDLDPSSMMPPSPVSINLPSIRESADFSVVPRAPSHDLFLRPDAPPIPRRSPTRPLAPNENAYPFPTANESFRAPDSRRGVAMSVSSMSVSSKKSRDSAWKLANLQTESVLSMSSSEDSEDEGSHHVSTKKSSSFRTSPRQANGREMTRFSETPLSPQRYVPSINPRRPSKNSIPEPQPSSRWSRSTEATFTSTETRGAKLAKSDSNRSGWSHGSQGSVTPVPDNEVEYHAPSMRSSTLSHDQSITRKPSTRVMTVTRQEEALLEAMRRTKARLRSDTGSSLETPAAILFDITEASPPPRSAARDKKGTPAAQKPILQTTIYSSSSSSDSSSTPPPHDFSYVQSSRHGSLAAPSDSGLSHDAPSTSRASPVTPPPPSRSTLREELPPLRVNSLRPVDPAAMPFTRHERNQTGSSGGVVLFEDEDDVDVDEVRLEDFPMWALSGVGVDKAVGGIAVA
ncbi:MAG: hypothetical protein Q9227_008546 [Pyrenula ochraceoflavens]